MMGCSLLWPAGVMVTLQQVTAHLQTEAAQNLAACEAEAAQNLAPCEAGAGNVPVTHPTSPSPSPQPIPLSQSQPPTLLLPLPLQEAALKLGRAAAESAPRLTSVTHSTGRSVTYTVEPAQPMQSMQPMAEASVTTHFVCKVGTDEGGATYRVSEVLLPSLADAWDCGRLRYLAFILSFFKTAACAHAIMPPFSNAPCNTCSIYYPISRAGVPCGFGHQAHCAHPCSSQAGCPDHCSSQRKLAASRCSHGPDGHRSMSTAIFKCDGTESSGPDTPLFRCVSCATLCWLYI